MHYSFNSKDALLTPTFKCLCGSRISFFVFWYFWYHREYSTVSTDKYFNVWERKQADKNSLIKKKSTQMSMSCCWLIIVSQVLMEMLKLVLIYRWPREGANNATGEQLDNIEGQVVSSHTQYEQLCWKCFWFSRHAIKCMPQTFPAYVEAGMCDCMPLSERLACIQERGVSILSWFS